MMLLIKEPPKNSRGDYLGIYRIMVRMGFRGILYHNHIREALDLDHSWRLASKSKAWQSKSLEQPVGGSRSHSARAMGEVQVVTSEP